MLKANKQFLLTALKFAVAFGLLYLLYHKKLLDLSLLSQFLGQPGFVASSLLLAALQIFICHWRWCLLLKSQQIPVTFMGSLPLSLIGLFFNFAIPGSVGGDLIKAYYVGQDFPHRKLVAISTVVLDRFIGLFAMVSIAIIAVFLNFKTVMSNSLLVSLSTSLILIALAVFGPLFLFMFFKSWRAPVRALAEKTNTTKVIFETLHGYKKQKSTVVYAYLLSFLAQFCAILFIYNVGVNLAEDISWSAYVFVVPLGFIASSLPIAPGGIGVGQFAFMFLFQVYTGLKGLHVGQTGVTWLQCMWLLISISGAYFYLRRKKPVMTEVES